MTSSVLIIVDYVRHVDYVRRVDSLMTRIAFAANTPGCRVCDAKIRPIDQIYWPENRHGCAYLVNFRAYSMMKNPDGRIR